MIYLLGATADCAQLSVRQAVYRSLGEDGSSKEGRVAEYCSECHWACRCIEFRAHDTGHAAIHLIEKLKRRETLTIDRYEIDLRDQLERGRAILAPGSSRIQSQPSHPFIMWAVA